MCTTTIHVQMYLSNPVTILECKNKNYSLVMLKMAMFTLFTHSHQFTDRLGLCIYFIFTMSTEPKFIPASIVDMKISIGIGIVYASLSFESVTYKHDRIIVKAFSDPDIQHS